MNGTLITPTGTDSTLLRVTHIVYALHALGLAIGAFGAATVLGSFLFGWPSIIARMRWRPVMNPPFRQR